MRRMRLRRVLVDSTPISQDPPYTCGEGYCAICHVLAPAQACCSWVYRQSKSDRSQGMRVELLDESG